MAAIRIVFAQQAASQSWREVVDGLRPRFAKAAECMDNAEEDVPALTVFPKGHWPKLASTDCLERLNKESKHRANVVGVFPNNAVVTRLVGVVLLDQNDGWQVSRRYLSLESLAPLLKPTTPGELTYEEAA